MKELEWMPLYWAKFIDGTSHMNAAQIGGYILLIREQWYKGSVPNDRKKLMQIARLGVGKSAEENLSVILEKFILQKNDVLINNTCFHVWEEQQKKYVINSERARKGAEAKNKKLLQADSKHTTSEVGVSSKSADNRVLSLDNTNKRKMPHDEFLKIIEQNEDDYLWMEKITKQFSFRNTDEANEQINFAYRKYIRETYIEKNEPIYFDDVKHVRNAAVIWYQTVRAKKDEYAKRKMTW